jgi:hypothetical protein
VQRPDRGAWEMTKQNSTSTRDVVVRNIGWSAVPVNTCALIPFLSLMHTPPQTQFLYLVARNSNPTDDTCTPRAYSSLGINRTMSTQQNEIVALSVLIDAVSLSRITSVLKHALKTRYDNVVDPPFKIARIMHANPSRLQRTVRL